MSIPRTQFISVEDAYSKYTEAGWQIVPVNGKTLAVKGATGRDGHTESVPPKKGQNVALRLPRGVIGIDVDAYGDKPGAETLKDCERKWGKLPATDRSGSREAPSGIYLYRVPDDFEAITALPGIELIQHHHRYMVVEPSTHPVTGKAYRWEPVGDSLMVLGGVEALPKLPDSWLEGLRATNTGKPLKRTESASDSLSEGNPCGSVTHALEAYEKRVQDGSSRHDAMVAAQYRLIQLGSEGHPGVGAAIDTLESVFVPEVSADRKGGSREAQREWDTALDGALRLADDPEALGCDCDGAQTNLPDSFWESRESLRHIRQAAHSRTSSADVVFYATLARMSAMVDYRTRVDTGVKEPASLNLFVAVVGSSGAGKTSGVSGVRKLMPAPADLDFRDGLPMGSGEGIAEAYYGTVWEEDPSGGTKKDGTPKVVSVRKQVRWNCFFSLDEGENLTKQLERSGTTIGPTLRSAWVGDLLGQANARQETTRVLPRGEYALGALIGYQQETAAALLDDSAAGTPQRFLFCSATDPSIPDKRIPHPGELSGYLLGPDNSFVDTGPLTLEFPEDLKDEMFREMRSYATGEAVIENPLDSHRSLMRAKVAALLALLDGRVEVTREDWDLSGVVWETSCAVRDSVVSYNLAEKTKREEAATRKRVETERRLEVARTQARPKLEKTAKALAKKVHDKGRFPVGELRKTLRSDTRELFAEATDYADEQGWVVFDENERVFYPGESKP
ncbi:bifunctional DNA primase/polymerase [Streptomonospora sp. PA3]|uniref:bifunctional DNA primase/polymerase n=1 Tax=Streptomonospora sp. PA3 TaxID=2607326 RepID=UPI0012DC32D1|nr:bifunctional DNA primase/polymerase [Streptomonospora sp. PA3]MUL40396.1 bifunctional DNA primase/polymerase [Streptomonospora sp. PA3]